MTRRRLTDADVVRLRERRASAQHTLRQLASEFGVSPETVRLVTTGLTRRRAGGPLSRLNLQKKLHDEDLPSVCRHLDEGLTVAQVAAVFGVSDGTVQARVSDWRKRHGLDGRRRGLTNSDVREIRELYAEGSHTQRQLAERFGVCEQTVNSLLRGKHRCDAGGPIAGPSWTRGEKRPTAKLTEPEMLEIRRLFASEERTLVELGKRFGVSDGLVSLVVQGRLWRHVGGPISTRSGQGERHHSAKLTEHDVRFVREWCGFGWPKRALAEALGVARSTVEGVLSGRTWRHVP